MNKVLDTLLPVLAVLFSVGGIAGFFVLFVRDTNVFWLVVAPIIFAMYQIPAAAVWWWWKKRKRAREEGSGPPEES
jgi:riboflavin transporter FmnP